MKYISGENKLECFVPRKGFVKINEQINVYYCEDFPDRLYFLVDSTFVPYKELK